MNYEKDVNYSKFRGNLVRKPELKGKYAVFTIACNRHYTNENGTYEADFIDCKLWKDPESFVNECDKGQKVEIECHTRTNTYTNEKGEKIYAKDLVVDKIEYSLNKNNDNQKDIQESKTKQTKKKKDVSEPEMVI